MGRESSRADWWGAMGAGGSTTCETSLPRTHGRASLLPFIRWTGQDTKANGRGGRGGEEAGQEKEKEGHRIGGSTPHTPIQPARGALVVLATEMSFFFFFFFGGVERDTVSGGTVVGSVLPLRGGTSARNPIVRLFFLFRVDFESSRLLFDLDLVFCGLDRRYRRDGPVGERSRLPTKATERKRRHPHPHNPTR